MTGKVPLASAGVASSLLWASAAAAAPIATPPSTCSGSFDPYSYTAGALSACPNIRTFPQESVAALPSGGTAAKYNVDGITSTYYTPPAGFDPVNATSAQLAEYGFPPRPSDPTLLSQWDTLMSSAKIAPAPPFLAELPGVSMDFASRYNWAGWGVHTGGDFTTATAEWYEPNFYASACSSPDAGIWAGIGGWNYPNSYVIGQDGTAFNLPGMADDQAWWEIYPDFSVVPVSLVAHPGAQFYALTQWTGSGWHFFMEDMSDGLSISTTVSDTSYGGQSAEAVVERPRVGGNPTDIANFGTMSFTKSSADGSTLDKYINNGLEPLAMYTTDGTQVMAAPGPMASPSNGQFTVKQEHCDYDHDGS